MTSLSPAAFTARSSGEVANEATGQVIGRVLQDYKLGPSWWTAWSPTYGQAPIYFETHHDAVVWLITKGW